MNTEIATTGAAFVAAIEEAQKRSMNAKQILDLSDQLESVIEIIEAHKRIINRAFISQPAQDRREALAAVRVAEKQPEGNL